MSRRPDWLVHQLPVGMAEDDFLRRFVSIFQELGDTVLDQVDNLPHLFDVTVAPPGMVRALGRWVGLDWVDPSLPDGLQRRIVGEYFSLLQWRGTKRGMEQLLELVSGWPAIVEDGGGIFPEGETPPDTAHVRLFVESSGWATEADLLRIVKAELPASVTFELYVGGERIWPMAGEGNTGLAELAAVS
jgi:phage tail-like protein